jgi:hypothetical protein
MILAASSGIEKRIQNQHSQEKIRVGAAGNSCRTAALPRQVNYQERGAEASRSTAVSRKNEHRNPSGPPEIAGGHRRECRGTGFFEIALPSPVGIS